MQKYNFYKKKTNKYYYSRIKDVDSLRKTYPFYSIECNGLKGVCMSHQSIVPEGNH